MSQAKRTLAPAPFRQACATVSRDALVDALWACAHLNAWDDDHDRVVVVAADHLELALKHRGERVPEEIHRAAAGAPLS